MGLYGSTRELELMWLCLPRLSKWAELPVSWREVYAQPYRFCRTCTAELAENTELYDLLAVDLYNGSNSSSASLVYGHHLLTSLSTISERKKEC